MGFHEGNMTARDYTVNKAARFRPVYCRSCDEITGFDAGERDDG